MGRDLPSFQIAFFGEMVRNGYQRGMDTENINSVWAVQEGYLNLLELVDSTAVREDKEFLRAEAQKTVLMLTAALIMVDGKYNDGEQALVRHLVDYSDKPGGELRYLNEYASLWEVKSNVIPHFIHAAVRCDRDIARSMLCEIQSIGNNVCVSGRNYQKKQREIIMNYMALLEVFIDRVELEATSQVREERKSGKSTEEESSETGYVRQLS